MSGNWSLDDLYLGYDDPQYEKDNQKLDEII